MAETQKGDHRYHRQYVAPRIQRQRPRKSSRRLVPGSETTFSKSLRKIAEAVISTLLDATRPLKSNYTYPTIGIREAYLPTVGEIAKGPILPQAKVNKCLIALVGTKTAIKTTDQVRTYPPCGFGLIIFSSKGCICLQTR